MKETFDEFEELVNDMIEEIKKEAEKHQRNNRCAGFCEDCYIYEGKIESLKNLLEETEELEDE